MAAVVGMIAAAAAGDPVGGAPATKPADRIAQLVGQLGAEDFQTREQASEELRKLGRSALPALKEAAKSEDPEVQQRAQAIIARIEKGEPTDLANRDWRALPGPWGLVGGHRNVRVTVVDGVKTIDAQENGRKIRITEDANGIDMTITENRDGKEVSEQFQAKDAEELKKNHPNAHEVYQRYAGGAGPVRIHIGQGFLPIQPLLPRPMPPDAMRQMKDAQKRLEEMIKEGDLPGRMREMLQEQMRRMQEMQNRIMGGQGDPEQPPKEEQKELDKQIDAQNKAMEDMRRQWLEGWAQWEKQLQIMQDQAQKQLEELQKHLMEQMPDLREQLKKWQEMLKQPEPDAPADPARI
jgi:hypothetical protein